MLAMWVKVRVKASERERFLKAIEVDALGSERDKPNCYRFNVLQDAADPNVYYFYEVYENEAALEKHRAMPHYAVWRAAADTLDAVQLGGELGERATLVQFSTAFCQPCRATRRTLTEVAGMVPGVAHIEVDAEAHLTLVRQLGINRTPTVLVLDAAGRIVRRAAGAPRTADVVAALGQAI